MGLAGWRLVRGRSQFARLVGDLGGVMGLAEVRLIRDRVLVGLGIYCLYLLQRDWLSIDSFVELETIIGAERYWEIVNFLRENRIMAQRSKPRIDLERLSDLISELKVLEPGGEPPESVLNFIREYGDLIRNLRINKNVSWGKIAEVLNRYNLDKDNPLTGKKLQTYWGLVFPDDKEVYGSAKEKSDKSESKGESKKGGGSSEVKPKEGGVQVVKTLGGWGDS